MAKTVVAPKVTIPRTPEWLQWHLKGVRQGALQIASDSKPFIHSIRDLHEHRAWEIYFKDEPKTWERFCVEAIKTEPQFVALLDEGVRIIEAENHQGPIPRDRALAAATSAKPLAKHGEIGNGRSRGSISISTGKRDADYLTARIARDRPDILEEMKAGKYRSVRAAAIEAGIIKVPTPVEQAKKAFLRLEEDERMEFAMWLHDPANFHDGWK
jgi:hypothetical protein